MAYRSRADSLTSILGGATWPISVSRFDDSRSNYRESRGGVEEPRVSNFPGLPPLLPAPLPSPPSFVRFLNPVMLCASCTYRLQCLSLQRINVNYFSPSDPSEDYAGLSMYRARRGLRRPTGMPQESRDSAFSVDSGENHGRTKRDIVRARHRKIATIYS